ncbi:helix-turn-helix domain-containing protein [Nocardia sp. NPDC057668]|uniref:helix-turn-helix domain-containing protein n=1 Tax=Nocardia sp. NPDC057668 TaxID=3346202 RepID=UPI00366DDC77
MGVSEAGDVGGAGWDFAGPVAGGEPGAALIGYRDLGGAGWDYRAAATTAVGVVIEFSGRDLTVDGAGGQRRLGGFVVGLPMGATRIRSVSAECVEVRLSPARAYSLLGVAAHELGPGVVSLDELWGPEADRLRERLAAAGNWERRFTVTKAFLAQRDRPDRVLEPEVGAAWQRIVAAGGQVRVAELARSLGWSRKRLWSRFEDQIGLTPKRAAMLARFRCATVGLLAGRPAAEVAAACGYTDQAHLCRDVAIFAERTPGSLRADALPAIAADRDRAWGTFFQSPSRAAGR